MISKRIFDLVMASLMLVFLFPLLIVIALWIKFDSFGPVFFHQERIGRRGVPFKIIKFRTMFVQNADDGILLTKKTDARITRCGKRIRKLKIDELPQFLNVFLGQMSIVGPRPEVQKYVDLYPESVREKVLSVRPGITDSAAIIFRNEELLLAAADDMEIEYVEKILPMKLLMYERYVDDHSLTGDLLLIYRTLLSVVWNR